MHILFLSDNFPPEVNAPANRTFEHCREWVKAGHEVTVITCVPNFPKGKVYAGYKNKLWQVEQMEGIKVIRVWTFITANEGFVRRILDYISFLPPAVMASWFVKKPDLVIGTSPQFFTACAAYLVSLFKRIPFVFELRDIWPESIKAVGAMKDSVVIRMLEKIELFLYKRAQLIISVTHSFKENLQKRGINGDKIKVVTNGVNSSNFIKSAKEPQLINQFGLEDKFVAGYVGTLGMAHHLETILEAAKLAQYISDDYRFIFLGDGARKQALINYAQALKLNNVIFIDSVPRELVVKYWSLIDVSIIHLKKMELFSSVIPSKLFECMAMGIPILHGVKGESAQIVIDNQVGEIFEPENAEQLFNHLHELKNLREKFNAYSINGLLAVKQYDRNYLAKEYLNYLQETLLETTIAESDLHDLISNENEIYSIPSSATNKEIPIRFRPVKNKYGTNISRL